MLCHGQGRQGEPGFCILLADILNRVCFTSELHKRTHLGVTVQEVREAVMMVNGDGDWDGEDE